MINQKKRDKKKSYTNSGTINIEWLRVEEEKSFLDYIQSGVQLHFTVAVDFTASNGKLLSINSGNQIYIYDKLLIDATIVFLNLTGDPSHPQSLHYRHPQMDNQYSLAIKAVGNLSF